MPGALNLTEPAHLLAKLEHEHHALMVDHANSYAAINALRDAWHLREWIWHDRLASDPATQTAIMGRGGNKEDWFAWVKEPLQFPDFPIVQELCNGSKHFLANPKNAPAIQATHQAGWGSAVPFWGNPHSGWGDKGLHVQVDAGRIVSVADLVNRVRDFWRNLFTQFPQLG
jgi:hypothetical protein